MDTEGQTEQRQQVLAAATKGRAAAGELARCTTATKNAALQAMADAVAGEADRVLQANADDLEAGRSAGLDDALLDRLRLTPQRLHAMSAGLRAVAELADPVGEVLRGYTLAHGVALRQQRVPLGVIGIVYEARPNVTVDAAGLTLKSGNAVLLRGSSTAAQSNAALAEVLREAIAATGLPADAVQLLDARDRESVRALITARGLVDLVIPRGGAGLISTVVREATVPTVETGVGNCHVYLDAGAPAEMAIPIAVNAKLRRVSVCNAAETLLVHRQVAEDYGAELARQLHLEGARLRVDARFAEHCGAVPAQQITPADDDTEFLSADLAVRVVENLTEAMAHIAAHGTGHTEAIVTPDLDAAQRFSTEVDAAAVMVNASTAFTDGGEFGLGSEIGISTQKLHARGPMALAELTSTKWIGWGSGQIRSAT